MRLTAEQEQLALVSIVSELGGADLDIIVTTFCRRYFPIHREWAKALLDAADERSFPVRSLLCNFAIDEHGELHVAADPGKLWGHPSTPPDRGPEWLSLIDVKVRDGD